MLDIECRHRSIMLVKKQILALSNHNDSNRMSKTDKSSFRHYQRSTNNICVFKRFLFWILDGTNQAIRYGGTWIWSSWQVNNIGKQAVDFLRFRTKMISTKKTNSQKFRDGRYSAQYFAGWEVDWRLQANISWETWKYQNVTARYQQQICHICTHKIAVPTAKPKSFGTVILLQEAAYLSLDRRSQTKS